jgi:hypothetical protein
MHHGTELSPSATLRIPANPCPLCGQHWGKIDLVVTDLIMPGIGGQELAKRLAGVIPRPHLAYLGLHGKHGRPPRAAPGGKPVSGEAV